MITRLEIPGIEYARATHYALGDGRCARVVVTPVETRPDRFVVEAQAFEIDTAGVLLPGPDGIASRTPGTMHSINRTELGDTATVQPGWVRMVGDYNDDTLPEEYERSAVALVGNNASGLYYNTVTGTAYRWDIGCLEQIRLGKAAELLSILLQQGDALQELGL